MFLSNLVAEEEFEVERLLVKLEAGPSHGDQSGDRGVRMSLKTFRLFTYIPFYKRCYNQVGIGRDNT